MNTLTIHTGREELSGTTSILAYIKAMQMGENLSDDVICKFINILEFFAILIRGTGCGLSAPLLVALNGAHVCHLHDYGLAEWACEAGRVGIVVASEGEASATSVARTQPWLRPKGKLVDGGSIARSGYTARCRCSGRNSRMRTMKPYLETHNRSTW